MCVVGSEQLLRNEEPMKEYFVSHEERSLPEERVTADVPRYVHVLKDIPPGGMKPLR
jgi:hypothetical protein